MRASASTLLQCATQKVERTYNVYREVKTKESKKWTVELEGNTIKE